MIRILPLIGLVGLLLAVDGIVSWLAGAPTWSWGSPWALGTALLAAALLLRLGSNSSVALITGGLIAAALFVVVAMFGLELGGVALDDIASILVFLLISVGTIGVGIFTMLRGRAGSEGANVWVYAVAGLAVVVLANYVGSRHLTQSYDLTKGSLESLSEQTVAKLRGLQSDVHVVAFFRDDNNARISYGQMLQKYSDISPRFSFEVIDPDKFPNRARDANLRTFPGVMVESGDRRERVTGPNERDLTSAIIKATRPGRTTIYWSIWHEERSITELGTFVQRLRELNYAIKPWRLFDGDIPQDCDVLVIAGPRSPFLPAEIERLDKYLARGGNLLLFVDPDTIGYGFEDLIAKFGASIRPNFIVERERGLIPHSGGYSMGGEQSVYVRTQRYGESEIVRDLRTSGTPSGFYLAREVRWRQPASVVQGGELVFAGSRLAFTETDLESFVENPRRTFENRSGRTGPFPIAVSVSAPATDPLTPSDVMTRLVVFGDSDFITDRGVAQERGNLTLAINAVSWLAEDPDLIAIQPREPQHKPLLLTRAQGTFLFLLSVWRYPAFVLVLGLTIWWYRKSRGPASTI